jgi:hypothetical protein
LRPWRFENTILDVRNAIPKLRAARTESPALERAVERALSRQRAAYAAEAERLVRATFELIRERGELEPPVAAIVRRARLSNQA